MKLFFKIKLLLLLLVINSNIYAIVINDTAITKPKSLTDKYVGNKEYLISGLDNLQGDLTQVIDLLKSGQKIKAKRMIFDILSKTPNEPEALHIAGIILMEEGRYDNAQVAFEAALRSNKKNPAIVSKLGVVRLLQGEREKSKRILDYALQLDSNNQLALRYLAWMAETDNKYEQAIIYLSRLLEIQKPNVLTDLHVTLAKLLAKQNINASVVSVLSPFIKESTVMDNLLKKEAAVLLVDSLLQTGEINKAELLLNSSNIKESINPLQLSVFKIESLIKQKKSKQAKKIIKNELKSSPENEHILRYAAAKQFAIELKFNRAINQMKQVVAFLDARKELNNLFSALNDLTALYIKAERKIDALRLLQKYAEKYPDSPVVIYQLAELQTSTGQFDLAQKNLDNIIEQQPTFVAAYYMKGIIYRRKKEYEIAEKWFSKTNDLDPNFEQAWIQRSGNAFESGNSEKAIMILETAVKKNESNVTLWFEYGALLNALEHHEKAVDAYKKVLSQHPNHLPSIDNLAGSLLILEKNAPDALYYAEKAYKMEPLDKVLQLNYLEALMLNQHYEQLLREAKKLKVSLNSNGRYHYYVGASQLHLGNNKGGIKHLRQAIKDTSLDKRIKDKTTKLLKQKSGTTNS